MTKREREFAINWAETYRLATWADAVATSGGWDYFDDCGRACVWGHIGCGEHAKWLRPLLKAVGRTPFGLVRLNDDGRFSEVQAVLDAVAYGEPA